MASDAAPAASDDLDDRRPVPRDDLLHRGRGRDRPAGPARVVARRLGADGERSRCSGSRATGGSTSPQDRSVTLTDDGPARRDGDRPPSPRRSSAGSSTCSRSTGRRPTSRRTGSPSRSPTSSIDRLDRSMGSPATCPHGNPIPGRAPGYGDAGRARGRSSPASSRASPADLRGRRARGAHAAHDARGPRDRRGHRGRGPSTTAGGDALTVRCGSRSFELPIEAARWIWVESPAS